MENLDCNGRAAIHNPHASFGPFEMLAILGFALIIASTFLDFTPIVKQNWRASGAGFPVAISCFLGAFLMLRRHYFAGFFIAVFAGFFLTHEIIIIYDNKAVELGKELTVDGWFRPVLEVYRNAFTFNTGAFWALVGVLVSVISICVGWVIDVVKTNNYAAKRADLIGEAMKVAAATGTETAREAQNVSENNVLADEDDSLSTDDDFSAEDSFEDDEIGNEEHDDDEDKTA